MRLQLPFELLLLASSACMVLPSAAAAAAAADGGGGLVNAPLLFPNAGPGAGKGTVGDAGSRKSQIIQPIKLKQATRLEVAARLQADRPPSRVKQGTRIFADSIARRSKTCPSNMIADSSGYCCSNSDKIAVQSCSCCKQSNANQCCGDTCYDPSKSSCCDNGVLYNSATHVCSPKGEVLEGTALCMSSAGVATTYNPAESEGCCGGQVYNALTQICVANSAVFNRSS